jgi:hypothetical protein
MSIDYGSGVEVRRLSLKCQNKFKIATGLGGRYAFI